MEGGGGVSPKNTGKIMRDLMGQVADDKREAAGLQNAFKDFILGQVEKTSKTILDDSVLSNDKLWKALRKYDPAMAVLYKNDPRKYQALKNVQKAIEIQTRSATSPLGGGSDTAENVNIVRSIVWKLIQRIPGLNMASDVAITGASKLKQIIDHSQEKRLMDFLVKASYDPELALTIMNTSKFGGRNSGQIARKIEGYLVSPIGAAGPTLEEQYLSTGTGERRNR
jgi:hypothetical protein